METTIAFLLCKERPALCPTLENVFFPLPEPLDKRLDPFWFQFDELDENGIDSIILRIVLFGELLSLLGLNILNLKKDLERVNNLIAKLAVALNCPITQSTDALKIFSINVEKFCEENEKIMVRIANYVPVSWQHQIHRRRRVIAYLLYNFIHKSKVTTPEFKTHLEFLESKIVTLFKLGNLVNKYKIHEVLDFHPQLMELALEQHVRAGEKFKKYIQVNKVQNIHEDLSETNRLMRQGQNSELFVWRNKINDERRKWVVILQNDRKLAETILSRFNRAPFMLNEKPIWFLTNEVIDQFIKSNDEIRLIPDIKSENLSYDASTIVVPAARAAINNEKVSLLETRVHSGGSRSKKKSAKTKTSKSSSRPKTNPKKLRTGPRGGRYYVSKGRKVYVA